MKKIAVLLLTLFAIQNNFAQVGDRAISTSVGFLLIAADARSAGMADQGVATSPDAFSQQYNPAKYAFALDKQGFSVSYTPYLTDLVNDISLGQVTYYNRFGEDGRNAFAGSLRYFGLGDIELRNNATDDPRIVSPNEFALDGSYSLKLSERFSMAVAGRYIRSQLRIGDETTDGKPASTFAVDIAGYYQSEEQAYDDFNGRWRAGFNFQNLGPKISYDDDELSTNFIPSNMRLGGGFDFIFDEYNKVGVGVEFTKLLVPTPQDPDINGDGDITDEESSITNEKYNQTGWVEGIFKSFGDAPGGFSEELKEFTYSVGTEYLYQDSFALRLGYFNENPIKGARKFFSLGAGFKYNVVKIDVSYLFSASKVKNPLENTLRFSLTFNFGEKYDEYLKADNLIKNPNFNKMRFGFFFPYAQMKEINITTQFSVFESRLELPADVQSLMQQAVEIRKKAYAPYSKFRVGAALLLDNGKVVLGSNQENAAYPSGLCAERVAVFHTGAVYPEAKIVKMAISAASDTNPTTAPIPPCGACRQSIAEYEFKQGQPIEIYFMGETGAVYKSDSLKNLLPFTFDKNFL